MAKAVITIKIMPESPEIDLNAIEQKVKEEITSFAGETETKTEIEPVAFGLKSLNITFVSEESKGSPDPLAEKVQSLEGIKSAEITDVRRAIG